MDLLSLSLQLLQLGLQKVVGLRSEQQLLTHVGVLVLGRLQGHRDLVILLLPLLVLLPAQVSQVAQPDELDLELVELTSQPGEFLRPQVIVDNWFVLDLPGPVGEPVGERLESAGDI